MHYLCTRLYNFEYNFGDAIFLFEVEPLNIQNVYDSSRDPKLLNFYRLISCIGKKSKKFTPFEKFTDKKKKCFSDRVGSIIVSTSAGIESNSLDIKSITWPSEPKENLKRYQCVKDLKYSVYCNVGDQYLCRDTVDLFDIHLTGTRKGLLQLPVYDKYYLQRVYYEIGDKCAHLLQFLEFNPYILNDMVDAVHETVLNENNNIDVYGIMIPIYFDDDSPSSFLSDAIPLSDKPTAIQNIKAFLMDKTISIIDCTKCIGHLEKYLTTKKMKSFTDVSERTIQEFILEFSNDKYFRKLNKEIA